MGALNFTHNPHRRSFVESANRPETDFPIQNLPFGVFSRTGERARGGVAIGDMILDLGALANEDLLSGQASTAAKAAAEPKLNALMAMGNAPASALRAQVSELLLEGNTHQSFIAKMLVPMIDVEMHLPARIGGFSDFLTSSYHATRLSPDGKLKPNFTYLPLGYHSRASTVRLDGEVRRPNVQRPEADGGVSYGPTREMDFELELGFYVGSGNRLGEPIDIANAADHIFGFCLLNDWSVRDTQRWENTPSGPFLSKNLSTTVSPWIITGEALEPFRVPAFRRAADEPAPLPYLLDPRDQNSGGIDLSLTATLSSSEIRSARLEPHLVTQTNFVHVYWTVAQMLAHHTGSGCSLEPGDLLASGTISGPSPESMACMAELTKRGSEPLLLHNGESRRWLEDGDEVAFHARADREGFASIGFGGCKGRIVAAPTA